MVRPFARRWQVLLWVFEVLACYFPFALRLSESPIAIACWRLFTSGPFLDPECSSPSLNLCISVCITCLGDFPFNGITFLLTRDAQWHLREWLQNAQSPRPGRAH